MKIKYKGEFFHYNELPVRSSDDNEGELTKDSSLNVTYASTSFSEE